MNSALLSLSEIITSQGQTIQKLDLIATVSIDGIPFLTVYRRYNSVHEMIVMDGQEDIYLQRDLPLLESLRRVLCLSPEQTAHVRIVDLFSFQHHGPPPTGHTSPLEMYWSEIQAKWQGIAVDLTDVWSSSSSSVSSSVIPSQSPESSDRDLVRLLSKKRSWPQRADGSKRSDTGKGKRAGEER